MQCVNISIVGDTILENNESFLANLTTDDPTIILSPSMAIINILNDESKYAQFAWGRYLCYNNHCRNNNYTHVFSKIFRDYNYICTVTVV